MGVPGATWREDTQVEMVKTQVQRSGLLGCEGNMEVAGFLTVEKAAQGQYLGDEVGLGARILCSPTSQICSAAGSPSDRLEACTDQKSAP